MQSCFVIYVFNLYIEATAIAKEVVVGRRDGWKKPLQLLICYGQKFQAETTEDWKDFITIEVE